MHGSLRAVIFALLAAAGLGPAQGVKPQGASFESVSNRLITPNGDRHNDEAVFRLNNPRFSEIRGRILDLRGSEVAVMEFSQPGMTHQATLTWRPGQDTASGVYIYVIESEEQVFTGTVVVVK